MNLPIDTAKVRFQAMSEPSLQTDFDTGVPKLNRKGEPVFAIKVLVLVEDAGAEIITVKVPGEQKGIRLQQPVKVKNLWAVPWSQGERAGISYRADAIEPEAAARS